jgi:hypothetical protein
MPDAQVDGVIWHSTPTATVGLLVAGGRIIDGPPYARKLRMLGRDARQVWREGRRKPGVLLAWLPDEPSAL